MACSWGWRKAENFIVLFLVPIIDISLICIGIILEYYQFHDNGTSNITVHEFLRLVESLLGAVLVGPVVFFAGYSYISFRYSGEDATSYNVAENDIEAVRDNNKTSNGLSKDEIEDFP